MSCPDLSKEILHAERSRLSHKRKSQSFQNSNLKKNISPGHTSRAPGDSLSHLQQSLQLAKVVTDSLQEISPEPRILIARPGAGDSDESTRYYANNHPSELKIIRKRTKYLSNIQATKKKQNCIRLS